MTKIVRPPFFKQAVDSLHERGLPPGDRTGWPEVDQYYTVVPGMLTIITGWPSCGKSEWLDALVLNLAPQGWLFSVYSPENLPHELHIAKWLEKLMSKPFGAGPTDRMTIDEVHEGMFELSDHFAFIVPKDDESLDIFQILETASVLFDDDFSGKKHGLIIDPWNDLTQTRDPRMSETEYIRETLSLVRRWARLRHVHVWIVAHPQKMPREDGKLPIPRPDMISGSQHWWNKADCAITVHRDLSDQNSQEVEIHVQKVKFKHVGRQGMAKLRYDRVTGRYHSTSRPMGAIKGRDE